MKTILLVDDENVIRESLAKVLENAEFTVFQAARGKDAIKIYAEKRPDCVLLDIILPDIGGGSVLRKIKEIDKNATVYLMTASTECEEVARALGAAGIIPKPVMLYDLMEQLKQEEVVLGASMRR